MVSTKHAKNISPNECESFIYKYRSLHNINDVKSLHNATRRTCDDLCKIPDDIAKNSMYDDAFKHFITRTCEASGQDKCDNYMRDFIIFHKIKLDA